MLEQNCGPIMGCLLRMPIKGEEWCCPTWVKGVLPNADVVSSYLSKAPLFKNQLWQDNRIYY